MLKYIIPNRGHGGANVHFIDHRLAQIGDLKHNTNYSFAQLNEMQVVLNRITLMASSIWTCSCISYITIRCRFNSLAHAYAYYIVYCQSG